MLRTELFQNLANTFYRARDSGNHNQVMPTLKDQNSESWLVSFSFQDIAPQRYINKQIKT